MHPNEQENHSMDATALRAAIGIALVALILAAALRCDNDTAAQPTEPATLDQAIDIGNGYDFTTNAGAALANLEQYLTSITTTTTRSAAAPAAGPAASQPGDDRWDQLAQCEAGGNWHYPPVAGGFSGGLMFHIGTWRAMGGLDYAPDAYLASREQQIDVAERTLAVSGWGAWPGCSRKFGWL